MYSDQELMDLWALNQEPVPFARSVLSGTKAPPKVPVEIHRLMALNDAKTAGPTWNYYWADLIKWPNRL